MKFRDGPVSLYISNHQYWGIDELGYTSVRSYDEDGRQRWSYIHRLNAIAWFYDEDEHDGPLDVLEPVEVERSDGSRAVEPIHIHHADACPLNNGEENLEDLPESEHDEHTNGPSRPWFYLEDVVEGLELDDDPGAAPIAVADGGRS